MDLPAFMRELMKMVRQVEQDRPPVRKKEKSNRLQISSVQ